MRTIDTYEFEVLKDEELMIIDGGSAVTFLVACYTVGYLVGKAYSHYRHSKRSTRSSTKYSSRKSGYSPLYGTAK